MKKEENMSYKDKAVLVTGGTGMIGRQLVDMLIDQGAQVRIASLDDPSRAHPDAEYHKIDLMSFSNCMKMCKDMEYVFHLAGVKGPPGVVTKKAATILVSFLRFNTNMMEAARQSGIDRYLYTSTIGIYGPAEIFYEDAVWDSYPSDNDWYGGWGKRMGELQADAYKEEYGWDRVAIVRPANVYGQYDNFDPLNSMVVPSLIRRAVDGEDPLVVWGDGTPLRDFIHVKDVARGMLIAMDKGLGMSINLASGTGISIKELVDIIIKNLDKKPKVVWDSSKPSGDKTRVMDITQARKIGFNPTISIQEGIKETIEWYKGNKDIVDEYHNVFKNNQREEEIYG